LILSLEQVQGKFPEAKESPGRSGLQYNVHCPKPHQKGGTYKMYINAENGAFYCQDCHYTGNVYREFFDPLEDMFPELFIDRPKPTQITQRGSTVRRGGLMWTPDICAPGETVKFSNLSDGHVAVEYLRERGFDIEELRALDPTRELFYCIKGQHAFPPPSYLGSTTGRIVFPIYMGGHIVGWQARQIDRVIWEDKINGEKEIWTGFDWKKFNKKAGRWDDAEVPKYYCCPGMRRSSCLYGFDMARHYKEIAVVEGPLDYFKVGSQCVCTFGKQITPDQIRLLKTYWDTLFILRDPEIDPNEKGFKNVLTDLSLIKVYHLALSNGKDPGANNRDQIWKEIAAEVTRIKTPPVNLN